ncbi:MAG: flagellar biosynthesis protein FliQ [Methylococcales bacterium]|jgi:flagellar biosynthesis protein FliQ|nr:flagellar biosynthesis protein FliQ [Methylococcales bacterium]MBT7445008.1 flagellar biosynthesis protein FliQ [Methylococcales bacterium]
MNIETIVGIGQQALEVTIVLAAPVMGSTLVIGLVVSMFQAATSINEQTLSFIPKLLSIAVVLALGGKWMLNTISDFTLRLWGSIPTLIQ